MTSDISIIGKSHVMNMSQVTCMRRGGGVKSICADKISKGLSLSICPDGNLTVLDTYILVTALHKFLKLLQFVQTSVQSVQLV